ncbi:MAG: hypothetical protein NPIRA06_04070 [Nitrospirales bacterium]|nr:MAG: hypothetical protein NPIRA06_04070 [Nitrospirales bacterium]
MAKACRIPFQAVKAGTMPHELVILRTALNPANLSRMEETDDKGTDAGHIGNEYAAVESIKEIEVFPPGNSRKKGSPGSKALCHFL